MRRTIIFFGLLVALSLVATVAVAQQVDRVTGTCTFAPGGSEWKFHASEGFGVPGTTGYEPPSGWVETKNWWFEGTWPVVACEVYNDTSFRVTLDVNGYLWTSATGLDLGEPGWKFDANDAGYTVSKGNLQIHNSPRDGD
ncbi:MAG: hypothetical protein CVT67_10875 [Actinobacteria bacterium HGW-Actinobacteria-7]|jgi:hypothetical protein|nr:MAG: hypothetical protein CVT67_10875 [Actinobacteria bacterium HGW-Actinobacteria-7]